MKAVKLKNWLNNGLVAVFFMFACVAHGQTGFHLKPSKYAPPKTFTLPDALLPLPYKQPARLPWSVDCLPFFCRIEHNMGLKSALPVKFRLGSVEYVDWLEGKSNWGAFQAY
jgi:hypothetical protein